MMTKIGLLCFLFMVVMPFGQDAKTGGEQRRLSDEKSKEREKKEEKEKLKQTYADNKQNIAESVTVIAMEITASAVTISVVPSLPGDHQSQQFLCHAYDASAEIMREMYLSCGDGKLVEFDAFGNAIFEAITNANQAVVVVPWSDQEEIKMRILKFLHAKLKSPVPAVKTAAAWTLLASTIPTGIVISVESKRTRLMPVVRGEDMTDLTVEIPVGGGAIAACLCNAKNITFEFCTSGIDRWVEAIKWSLYEVDAALRDLELSVPPLIAEALLQNIVMPLPDLPFWHRCDAVPQAFQSALSKHLSYVTIVHDSDLFSRVWTAVEVSKAFCNR